MFIGGLYTYQMYILIAFLVAKELREAMNINKIFPDSYGQVSSNKLSYRVYFINGGGYNNEFK